jgi:hypothetical protein
MFQRQDQLPVFWHASTVTHEMKHQMCSEMQGDIGFEMFLEHDVFTDWTSICVKELCK